VDGGEEVTPGLVVSGGNGTKLLELGKEVLDQMACLVEMTIIVTDHLTVGFGGDDRGLASNGQWLDNPLIGIERLITDQGVGLHGREKVICPNEVMSLATSEEEADEVAQCVGQGVDLGAQSAARATDRLVLAEFFWAPALC
jgi:hypothetical protein